MWVEIKSDVFNPVVDVEELRKLIQDLCYKHRYNIFLDIAQIEEKVFETFYDSNLEIIAEYFNLYITECKPISYFITNVLNDQNCFNVSEGVRYFNSPLQVILENSNNDGYFIDALIREFKSKSKKIKRFKDENWISYSMGGGSDNIIHFIEAEKKKFNNDIRFLKLFVIVDSDLEYPHSQNEKRKKLEDYFDLNSIPYHILEKREIENYLPDEIFRSIEGVEIFINSYLKLSSIQKDFIDIEKGFQKSKNQLTIEKPNVFKLYENLTEKQFSELRFGINRQLRNFKSEFPKLFIKSTKEGLIQRTQDQNNPYELQEILDKINKLL
jgi:hypothetical protein